MQKLLPKLRLRYRDLRSALVGKWSEDFIAEWKGFIVADKSKLTALQAFAKAEIANGTIGRIRTKVIDRLEFLITHYSALVVALPAEFYKDGFEAAVAELRLPRDDFDVIKSHYVDSYELAYKTLRILVGFLNVIERGNADTFDPSITALLTSQGMTNFKKIGNLAAFEKKPNAPKKAFLNSLPACQTLWDDLLIPDLRNAVGHYGAHHDLVTGIVLVDDVPHCTYLEFIVRTTRMTHVLVGILHVLKTCHLLAASSK